MVFMPFLLTLFFLGGEVRRSDGQAHKGAVHLRHAIIYTMQPPQLQMRMT
jgi:hypothetical protein